MYLDTGKFGILFYLSYLLKSIWTDSGEAMEGHCSTSDMEFGGTRSPACPGPSSPSSCPYWGLWCRSLVAPSHPTFQGGTVINSIFGGDQSHTANKSHCWNPGRLTPDSAGSQKSKLFILIEKDCCNWRTLAPLEPSGRVLSLVMSRRSTDDSLHHHVILIFHIPKIVINQECFLSAFCVPSTVSDSKPFLLPPPSVWHPGFSADIVFRVHVHCLFLLVYRKLTSCHGKGRHHNVCP